MPAPTDGEVAVVKADYVLEEAYRMGHNEFSDFELDDDEEADLSGFKSYARWANVLAPRLRAMSGAADHGHGTFQDHRQVAVIRSGCEEDEPAEADLMDSRHVYEAVVSAWDMGALDGATDTYDPESALYEL